jgi:hypothetical protein
MKKIITPTLLIALIALILSFIMPWWSIVIAGFVVAAAMIDEAGPAFISGFLGITFLWIIMTILRDSGSNVSVAETLGDVVGGVPAYLMFLITGITGGFVGGLGAMTGTFVRSILLKKEMITD